MSQEDGTMGQDDAGGTYEARHEWGQGDQAPGGPTPAQAAAARGAYEDVQASTGGAGGEVRHAGAADPVEAGADALEGDPWGAVDEASPAPGAAGGEARPEANPVTDPADPAGVPAPRADSANAHLAEERLADLQRLQAEYVNYKRRVDRDRAVESERAIAGVMEALLPVLDEIHLARQHGELEVGPFAKIAEKLEAILARYGVERYGQPGETFDPTVHEAVMHTHAELAPGTTQTTVIQIMQPGYRMGEKVVRAALVAVADPA